MKVGTDGVLLGAITKCPEQGRVLDVGTGTGLIAITTHFEPITLRVQPGAPVRTDPNATIAWSGNLQPQFKTDVSLKSFLGRGSGESIQMEFNGEGFVVVQPYEEIAFQHSS